MSTQMRKDPLLWRRLTWVSALLALASIPWWGRGLLRRSDFFRVRRVEIDGTRYVSPDEIVSRLRMDSASSIWDDLDVLERRIRQHPSVRTVHIERKPPGTLFVQVTENFPVALVQAATGLVPVDAVGRSLPIDPATADVDLPLLADRDTLALRILGEIRERAPALFARIGEVRRLLRGDRLIRLTDQSGRVSRDVLVSADLTVDRLSDVLPVEQDLSRRNLRAVELDLRFRDQVIARLGKEP